MIDLYMQENGDMALSSTGDLALSDSTWRQAGQEAYFRVMTEDGDFLIHPDMGTGLSKLFGLPNSPATANYGIQLISDALTRDGRFSTGQFFVRSVPVSQNEIRFDIGIVQGGREQVKLQVTQQVG